jgi:hypothetical protein
MNRPGRRTTRGLEALRRARLDNITLVPASLLPFKEQWHQLANSMPTGEVLFVVPEDETPLRQTMRQLVPQLRARGRHITAIPAGQFS